MSTMLLAGLVTAVAVEAALLLSPAVLASAGGCRLPGFMPTAADNSALAAPVVEGKEA